MKRLFLITASLLLAFSCSKLDMENDIIEGAETAVSWMTPLPDDTPVARLSIPGAHDAATSSITSWPMWTKTQELDIAALWNAGVRAFDLRPALVDGKMGIYHDKYSANVGFMEILNALVVALDTHPGEGAIIVIRHEEEADGNTPDWGPAMKECLESVRSRLVPYHSGIMLWELRGKILFLSRNAFEGCPMGANIKGWTSGKDLSAQKSAILVGVDGVESPFWVQDYYDPEGTDDKWEEVKDMLDATAYAAEPYPLVVNHVSGYVGNLPDYRTNAKNINSKAAAYIRESGKPAGIVMMDFAGVDRSNGKSVGGATLVKAIIENN